MLLFEAGEYLTDHPLPAKGVEDRAEDGLAKRGKVTRRELFFLHVFGPEGFGKGIVSRSVLLNGRSKSTSPFFPDMYGYNLRHVLFLLLATVY